MGFINQLKTGGQHPVCKNVVSTCHVFGHRVNDRAHNEKLCLIRNVVIVPPHRGHCTGSEVQIVCPDLDDLIWMDGYANIASADMETSCRYLVEGFLDHQGCPSDLCDATKQFLCILWSPQVWNRFRNSGLLKCISCGKVDFSGDQQDHASRCISTWPSHKSAASIFAGKQLRLANPHTLWELNGTHLICNVQ